MNKKFYFALALTAGLFASCSSDDLSQAPSLGGQNGNPDGAINLSIANGSQGVTRGTGTVGNTNAATAQWAGQKVNIYMLKTGTLDQAYELKDDGTDDDTKPLFQNQEMVVEQNEAALILDIAADATDAAWKDRTVTSKYFPGSGVYDFWGYRTDGAETGAPAVNGTNLEVPFEIDGSQDLMSGKATPLTKAGVTANDHGYWNADKSKVYGYYGGANVDVDPSKIYSAYSARREIDPVLHFSHRLARFTFQVKGANAGCCIAEGEADPDKIAKAINVTEIKVKNTKYKGDLVIAYTTAAEPAAITWNTADLTDLVLKQRVKKVTAPATGDYYGIKVVRAADDPTTGDPRYTYTVKNAAYPGGADVAGALAVHGTPITGAMEVWDDVTPDPNTNLPSANKTTIAAIETALATAAVGTASAEYFFYEVGTPVYYSLDPADIDLTANLVALDPVQPVKNAGDVPQKTNVGEAILLPADVNEYKIEVLLRQRLVKDTKTVVDANGNVIFVNNAAAPTTYYLKQPAVTAADAVYTTTDLYAIPAGVTTVADATELAAAAKALTTTGDKVYFVTDTKKYVNVNVTSAYDATGPTDAVYTTSDLYTEPAGVIAVADNDALTAAAKALDATGHKVYKVGTTKYVDVNVTTAAVASAAEFYYLSGDPTKSPVDISAATGVGAVEWVTETTEEKNMLVKQTIKLPNDPSTMTPMSFKPGESYNVVLTINGFETIGGQGTDQPIVDAYTEYDENGDGIPDDIELNDETED